MTQADKLLAKAIENPAGLSYQAFLRLLAQHGWRKIRQSGSHEQWSTGLGPVLSIQNNKGKAKAYQVKQFLTLAGLCT